MSVGPDPLDTVRQALDAGGYDPHGPEFGFRARCPGHQGENADALHVVVGADGRVLLHCFRGCDPDDVVRALGLAWRDLFPTGHRFNRRRARPRPEPRGAMETVLDGLQLVGIPVRGMWVADACPYCDKPGLWLLSTRTGGIDVSCTGGCARDEILGALETIVAIEEARNGSR